MTSERAAEAARRGSCGTRLVKLGATGLAVEKIGGTYVLVAIFPKEPKNVPAFCGTVRIITRIQTFEPA